MRATLWGADHVELDRIASASAGEHAAVAITRGRFAKLYSYEDPNEDAVAVVAGPRSTLLICADGHYGVTSSHVAVQAVLDALGDDPPPALDDDGWAGVFGAANDAIVAAKEGEGRHPASDTVLMAALVTPGQLSYASIGDAALVVCRPGEERGRQLNREAMRFLGRPMTRRGVRNTVQRQTLALEPDQWVVAVTDGLSEFIAPLRPADVVPRVLADGRSGSVEAAAVAVVEAACAAGAGDNVAVALVAPAPEG